MHIVFIEGDGIGIMITPDPFSPLNVVLMVMTDDPERDFAPIILPIAALQAVIAGSNAKS